MQRAMESLLRSRSGNGIRVARPRLLALRFAPWFEVTEDELTGILPGEFSGREATPVRAEEGFPVLSLGRTSTGRIVGPPVEADQGRHLAVLGETGMGKSSTLVTVALRASALWCVILLDPLGETASAFVAGLGARSRSRLTVISPRAASCAINALEGAGIAADDPVRGDRRLNDLVHALRRVRSGRYSDASYWGPRLEEMLTRAVSAAAGMPGGTLEDAHTLLATGGRTRQVVPPSAQDDVRSLADRVRARPDDAEGARRLLYEVVRSPVLARLLCARVPDLHVSDLVVPGRIVVVSGDASVVGETVARYLLSVYLALVWSELLGRTSNAKTFVVLDESQWFSHESLAEMLRLARRRNVHVVLATQTVGSLPESVADAVWTNVSDFVAFRGSPEEARELSRAAPGVSVEAVLSLPRGHAAVLLGKGNSVSWVRTAGRPPPPTDRLIAKPRTGDESAASDVVLPLPSATSSVGEVLEWIRERSRSVPSEGLLRVELDELRKAVDPTGRAVRAAGSILGRAGAIVGNDRTGSGTTWVIDPRQVPGGPD